MQQNVVLNFQALSFRGLSFWDLGFRGLGFRGLRSDISWSVFSRHPFCLANKHQSKVPTTAEKVSLIENGLGEK